MKKTVAAGALVLGCLLVFAAAGCAIGAATTTSSTTSSSTTTTTEAPATWRNLTPGGEVPSQRCYGALVYDSTLGKVFMFGGFDGQQALGETWAYDPGANVWANLNPASEGRPTAAAGLCGAYDPAARKVISFDGTSWGYNTATNKWAALSPRSRLSPARLGSCMVYCESTGKVLLFGGTNMATWYNDLWTYDSAANAWTKLEPTGDPPPGRSDAGLAYDRASGKVILFGGMGADFACLNDTWAYDPVANTWTAVTPIGEIPAARNAHAMAYDPHSATVILFGGIDSNFVCYSDTWAYDPAGNTWTQLAPVGNSPGARGRCALVYADTVGKLILFGGTAISGDTTGGFGGQVYFNDTWAFGVDP
jgi:hypothetical protein